MLEFQDKIVIVTGGAKGIGAGISRAFVAAGAQVFCADVDVAAGQAISTELQGPGQLHFVQADVAQSADCQRLVAQAAGLGGVDILCNNVGIQPTASYLPAHEMPEEVWDQTLNVNLKSAFLMTKYTIPEMRKRGGGAIINTASVQGLQSAYNIPAYAASKGGIISLTRQLALDYAADNIRVLAVNPGTIETPLVAEAAEAMGQTVENQKSGWAAMHPIGRIGQPADIANAVLFLASDKASFMTGENICVDGGIMAKGSWA